MLYIVATPIGNLSDVSQRSLDILKEVDIVLCEDTRVTSRLLNRYEIKKQMSSLHQHSTDEKIQKVLEEYENIAYVSDAGTPGISDPGNKLVQRAVEMGIDVSPIPGPSAVISSLSVSGFPTDKFLFLGFMPKRGKNKVFEIIKSSEYTVAFYESPHRILKTLEALVPFVADKKICVCRELTKKFESIYRGDINEVIKQVEDKQKGEFVVIVSK
jgi:16S rRNA (cytidine1402-2'-O)-methyltransferase